MIIAVAALLVAATTADGPQRLVALPDGRRLNLACSGEGSPTLVLEAGFAATSWAWTKVQPLLARRNKVCAYDRAGMGFSDPGPMPRDARAINADLAALLKAAKLAPPYILVGHSAGAMTVRLFADSHPDWIAGLVLVDPSIEGQFDEQETYVAGRVAQFERCAAAAAAHSLPSADPALARCTPPLPATWPPARAAAARAWSLDAAHWQAQASEFAAIAGTTTDALRDGRQNYGDLPLVVLTAGGSAAQDPRWEARHAALAARSTRGVQHTVVGASHNLMNDAPQAVVEAVAEIDPR